MSDEIDLRVYAKALRRRWWVVAIFVVAALAAAFAISAIQPKHYQAEATLTATAPRLQWRFDAGIQPILDTRRDYQREYLAIARSNRIFQRAADQLNASGQPSGVTPQNLAPAISVRTGDANTLLVTATAGKPQQAADLANTYAQAFVEVARELAGTNTDLANYQSELEIATQKLNQAEKVVADARSSTGFLLVSGTDPNDIEMQNPHLRELDLKNRQLAEYTTDLGNIRYLASQLESAQPGADLSQLPWEMLAGPIIGQRGILSPVLALKSLDDPQALLAQLRSEEAALSATVDLLTQETGALKQEVADEWRVYSTASRNYGLARDTYSTLSRKVTEAEIQQRIDPSQLALVSEAIPPAGPAQTRQVAMLAVAGVIGLILGVIVALWLGLRAEAKGPLQQPATAA